MSSENQSHVVVWVYMTCTREPCPSNWSHIIINPCCMAEQHDLPAWHLYASSFQESREEGAGQAGNISWCQRRNVVTVAIPPLAAWKQTGIPPCHKSALNGQEEAGRFWEYAWHPSSIHSGSKEQAFPFCFLTEDNIISGPLSACQTRPHHHRTTHNRASRKRELVGCS